MKIEQQLTSADEHIILTIMAKRYKEYVDNTNLLVNMPEYCDKEHLKWMLTEIITNSKKYSYGKMCRWLGFIQGILASKNIISVTIERDFSRPLFKG